MASTKTGEVDSEVHITYEDQQKINKYARLNARFDHLKADILGKKGELDNLTDAESELELADDDDKVLYSEGEIFVYKTVAEARESLAEYKKELTALNSDFEEQMRSVRLEMDALKVHLYRKFGDNINLELDED